MDDSKFYIAYFGRSADYYLNVLYKFASGSRFVFNPFALISGLFWFLFRKLYKETLVIVAISFLINEIESYAFLNPTIGNYSAKISLSVTILINALYGILANHFYMKKAIKRVEYAKSVFSTEEEIIGFLSAKGGTTMHPIFIIVIVLLVALIISSKLI